MFANRERASAGEERGNALEAGDGAVEHDH